MCYSIHDHKHLLHRISGLYCVLHASILCYTTMPPDVCPTNFSKIGTQPSWMTLIENLIGYVCMCTQLWSQTEQIDLRSCIILCERECECVTVCVHWIHMNTSTSLIYRMWAIAFSYGVKGQMCNTGEPRDKATCIQNSRQELPLATDLYTNY